MASTLHLRLLDSHPSTQPAPLPKWKASVTRRLHCEGGQPERHAVHTDRPPSKVPYISFDVYPVSTKINSFSVNNCSTTARALQTPAAELVKQMTGTGRAICQAGSAFLLSQPADRVHIFVIKSLVTLNDVSSPEIMNLVQPFPTSRSILHFSIGSTKNAKGEL